MGTISILVSGVGGKMGRTVAQAVNDFLQSERIVNQAAPGRQNPFEQIQQEVVVVPEIVRNQLIISATPRFFDQIMELVENLDSKPPQVLIQVILAEVLPGEQVLEPVPESRNNKLSTDVEIYVGKNFE